MNPDSTRSYRGGGTRDLIGTSSKSSGGFSLFMFLRWVPIFPEPLESETQVCSGGWNKGSGGYLIEYQSWDILHSLLLVSRGQTPFCSRGLSNHLEKNKYLNDLLRYSSTFRYFCSISDCHYNYPIGPFDQRVYGMIMHMWEDMTYHSLWSNSGWIVHKRTWFTSSSVIKMLYKWA